MENSLIVSLMAPSGERSSIFKIFEGRDDERLAAERLTSVLSMAHSP